METKQYNPSILPHIPTVEEDRLRSHIAHLEFELKLARARIKDRDDMLSGFIEKLDEMFPKA